MKSGKIQFDRAQVDYLMEKTGATEPQEAVEIFAKLIRELQIDPHKMHAYLKRMMEMDGV